MPREIYLDWNATSPPSTEVVAVMNAARERLWGNPASVHSAGRRARAALEGAREELAAGLDFFPRDVIFTGSGTEANNLALFRAEALITSRIEHPSVVEAAKSLEAKGRPVVWLPVSESGAVAALDVRDALHSLPDPTRATVAIMAANHETGVLQPLGEVGRETARVGAKLHVDAVQLVGKAALDPLQFATSVTLTAHKIRGPKGIAALLFRGPPPPPVLVGGAQERGLRPGTVDAVAALGFATALCRALQRREDHETALGPLRDRLEAGLAGLGEVNGQGARLSHVSNISFTQLPGPELVAALDLDGICVSSGSACSAGTMEPSSVISAMQGLQRAQGAVRFSLGEDTEPADIERVLTAIRGCLQRT